MKTHYAGNYSLTCAVAIQPKTDMSFLLFPVAGRHYHTTHVWRPLFQNVRVPFVLFHVYYSTWKSEFQFNLKLVTKEMLTRCLPLTPKYYSCGRDGSLYPILRSLHLTTDEKGFTSHPVCRWTENTFVWWYRQPQFQAIGNHLVAEILSQSYPRAENASPRYECAQPPLICDQLNPEVRFFLFCQGLYAEQFVTNDVI